MKNFYNMTPDELEIFINDAADGLLNKAELKNLEKALEAYPGLMQDYRDIMNLPDFNQAYGSVEAYQNHQQVERILDGLNQIDEKTTFYNTTVVWFKKYALAASLLIFAMTSVFYFTQPEILNGDISFEEFYYPDEAIASEDYATYLDDWFEQ
jgi:hypothetical protein